jgi:NAD-dependent histone deacetylase SIR2
MADLVLVIGTSLTVFPFAKLPDMAFEGKPRVLFNLERVGTMGTRADDVLELGDCDSGIRKLAEELGWREELEELWTSVVGEEEATRQKVTRKQHEDEVEEEVILLAQEVEAALNIEETPRRDSDTDRKDVDEQAANTKVDENKAETKEDDTKTDANQNPEPENARPSETEAMPTATAATPEQVTNAESKTKDTVPTSSVEPAPETRAAAGEEAGADKDTKETKDTEKSVL